MPHQSCLNRRSRLHKAELRQSADCVRRRRVHEKMDVESMTLSRRTFLAGSALTVSGRASAAARLEEFAYGQVRLTEGPLAEMYRRIHTHYVGLDEDRLLK